MNQWRWAERHIELIEATTPSLDGPVQRFDKLCAAIEDDVARLRAPVPRTGGERARPQAFAADQHRAEERIGAAEEMLDEMAKWSREANANADEWERRAMLAVQAGSDELAREALARRSEWASTHRTLQREVDAGRAVVAEMRAALAQLAPAGDVPAKQ